MLQKTEIVALLKEHAAPTENRGDLVPCSEAWCADGSSTEDLAAALDRAVERVRALLGLRSAAVFLFDPDPDSPDVLAAPRDALPELEEVARRLCENGELDALRERQGPVLHEREGASPVVVHLMRSPLHCRAVGVMVGEVGEDGRDIACGRPAIGAAALSECAAVLENCRLCRGLQQLEAELVVRTTLLESSLSEVQRFSLDLEGRVAERTRELTEANEELSREIADRMRAEEKYRSNESMLRLALEGVGEGLWLWDVRYDQVDLSPLSMELLGCASDPATCPPEMRSRNGWEALIHPDDVDRVRFKKNKCVEGSIQGYSVEYRIPDGAGGQRWILERGRVVLRDGRGLPIRIAGTHSDVTKRRELEEQIRHQANHDYLTGLPNRYLFSDRLSLALARANRNGSMAALVFIDMDNFKTVNDEYGHEAGDELLKMMADRMRGIFREVDTVCRIGGDEFAVVLSDICGRPDAEAAVERLMDAFDAPFPVAGGETLIRISAGVSLFPDDGTDEQALLRCADMAMYRTKQKLGRSACTFAQDILPGKGAR